MCRFAILMLLGVAALVLSPNSLRSDEPKPDPARAARNVREIIGHRGSCADRPENTLASYRRAIEAGATVAECDVRTTKDGFLVSSHDPHVNRTSNGTGAIADLNLAELKKLDFGSRFDPKFKDERMPTLREILELCKGKIHVMLDLKEEGESYADRITAEVKKHGVPKEIVLGIRSVEQARLFRKRLPQARQIGLIPTTESLDAFATAGVDAIRLWPKWLAESSVAAVRKHKLELHLAAPKGTREDVLAILLYAPESVASDDPARLVLTLAELAKQKE
jgi:glycerophosphoryl diester phosphodiesterase